MRIAAFPWYELPETAAAQEALWSAVARRLRKSGLSGVPGRLTRGLPVPASSPIRAFSSGNAAATT